MELNTVRETFEHVAKKQKLSSSKFHEVVDTISHEIEQAMATIKSEQDPTTLLVDGKSVLTQLKIKLNEFGPQKELENTQKELNTNINKYLKLLEKVFNPDISKGYRNVDFDVQTINEIVTNYFFRHDLFDIGDCLIKEAGLPEGNALRTQFFEMHQILEAVRAKDIQPALNWVSANREKLKQSGSSLELKLHQLQYVELLKQGRQRDAFKYLRSKLSPLGSSHVEEIQKLTGCLIYIGRLENCPYSQILAPSNLDKLVDELSREFCVIMGQPSHCPLEVSLEAGSEGLPTVLKLASVMAAKPHEWEAVKQLAVPVELSEKFYFHSTFVCPVTRDEGTPENPPMLLPCGHVLCGQSIMKMSKNSSRRFKCPYCPLDAAVSQCRQLYL